MTLKELLLFYDQDKDSNEEFLTDYLLLENEELKKKTEELKKENEDLKFINGLLKNYINEVDL